MNELEKKSVKEIISDVLLEAGVPDHLKGYDYITHSIWLCLYDKNSIHNITKCIYQETASKFNENPSRVERCISKAIEYAFNNAGPDTIYKFFGNTVNPDKGKATNGQFIARIVNVVRRELCEESL